MTGELIALASAALYALSGVAIARGAAEGRAGDNGTFLSIVFTAALSLALWVTSGEVGLLTDMQTEQLVAAIGLFIAAGVFSTVLGRWALFRSVALGGAVRASVLRRLTPVLAALFALVLLLEIPGWLQLAGMALVLGGTVVLQGARAGAGIARPGWVTWGVGTSAFYGLAYVLRKIGLQHMAGPVFGALVGAVTGLAWYLLAAPFNAAARQAILSSIRGCGRWQVVAAAAMALAQIGQFLALARTDVATVAVIGSAETVISIFLAVVVFRSEPLPGATVLMGAAVSTFGVVLLVLG